MIGYWLARFRLSGRAFLVVKKHSSNFFKYKIRYKVKKKKEDRTRVQVKDIKLRIFKYIFLRFKSKYLCCGLQNKIIKNTHLQNKKNWHGLSLPKPAKMFVIHYLIFQTPMKLFSNVLSKKNILFSDISLPWLGKNMSITMQNMTESPKKSFYHVQVK